MTMGSIAEHSSCRLPLVGPSLQGPDRPLRLREWRRWARPMEHSAITDLPLFGIAVLPFKDPDGVALELTAPL